MVVQLSALSMGGAKPLILNGQRDTDDTHLLYTFVQYT
jgi:hypothetical protein